jgi:WD40 repeat protein
MINISKLTELTGHSLAVYALCAEDENFIFSGGVDKKVIRWDINNVENSKVIINSSEAIYSLYYLKEKKLLFIGTSKGKIHIIDLHQKKETKLLQSHTDRIFEFKLYNSHLISVSADGCLAFTNINTLKTEQVLKISDERIRSIDIKNNLAIIACGDSKIRVLDLKSKKIINSFVAHHKSCNVVKFHPTQDVILTGGWDAQLKIWDKNYKLINSIPAHSFAIYSIVFSPDNKLFATCSRDKTIKIWNASNIELPKTITRKNYKGHQFSVNRLLWQEKSEQLISASDDKKLMVWSIDLL